MKKSIFFIFFLYQIIQCFGQGSAFPYNEKVYHILDRLEIKSRIAPSFHSSLKDYTRAAVGHYALQVDTAQIRLNSSDRIDLYRIFKDNNEWIHSPDLNTTIGGKNSSKNNKDWIGHAQRSAEDGRYTLRRKPVFKIFYPTPANMIEVNDRYFHMRINPVFNLMVGKEKGNEEIIFNNLRGLNFRGGIDDRIYLYFDILETQARFPSYVNQRIERDQAVPGAGLYKNYKSAIFNINKGYDFLNSKGFVGFNITPHVGLQFGYGRHFIGNGYRSLLLSSFSNNYLYLKLNWKVWKFHYQNIFAELAAGSAHSNTPDKLLPKKYMATHHLSFNVTPNLNFGIFETVIFSRENHFELHYLNPIILYRTVEHGLGSPDNVLIGLDGKWNLLNRFQLYGQLILDEFKFDELFVEKRGWWANKFGLQAGLKYIDIFGVDHLDLQAEYNTAKPYTYSHNDSLANYAHYNQPLAHPLGANFKEALFRLKYQPMKKLDMEMRYIRATFGEDDENTNWGGNILLPNNTREQDYENVTSQGINTLTNLIGIDISYEFRYNFFIDLHYFYRKQDSELAERDFTNQYFGGGIRVNIDRQRMDF